MHKEWLFGGAMRMNIVAVPISHTDILRLKGRFSFLLKDEFVKP
jgi:hypothetical protein